MSWCLHRSKTSTIYKLYMKTETEINFGGFPNIVKTINSKLKIELSANMKKNKNEKKNKKKNIISFDLLN